MRRISTLSLCGAVLVSAYVLAQGGPESARRDTLRFDRRVVVSGLESPWELTWGPDGMLWVTERTGPRVTRVDPVSGERHVALVLDGLATVAGPGGVLGMALHPELLRGTGHDDVFLAVTYEDQQRPPDMRVTDPASPFRHLYAKVIRVRYHADTGTLTDPVTILDGLPAGNDHAGLRLKIAADGMLHLTIGDQGNNQLGNYCQAVLAQRLPTRDEVDGHDWSAYEGKTLRLALDGSIPPDNPTLAGVVSHVYTYGHRNPQGLAVGPDGTLYTTDHGPKTDDEVNVLTAGGNYGWPHVAGLRDDKAYEYARWAEATTPCTSLRFNDVAIDPSVPRAQESAFRAPMMAPLVTLFTVASDFPFDDPACQGFVFICWPTVAASSIEYYDGSGRDGIPGWDAALIVSTLKRGSLYVVPLDASKRRAVGPIMREAQTQNRYRDTAVHPDGRTIFVATDGAGLVEAPEGGATTDLRDRGAILAFTYAGAGDGRSSASPVPATRDEPLAEPSRVTGPPPTLSRRQVEAGKVAYDGYCAVCHGSTLTNGTFGTPLAGEYFQRQWRGRTVAALFEKSRATMPPSAAGSLPPETYAAILAYVFEVNGVAAGPQDLPADQHALRTLIVP